jgi:hypothetical protein
MSSTALIVIVMRKLSRFSPWLVLSRDDGCPRELPKIPLQKLSVKCGRINEAGFSPTFLPSGLKKLHLPRTKLGDKWAHLARMNCLINVLVNSFDPSSLLRAALGEHLRFARDCGREALALKLAR